MTPKAQEQPHSNNLLLIKPSKNEYTPARPRGFSPDRKIEFIANRGDFKAKKKQPLLESIQKRSKDVPNRVKGFYS